MSARRVVPAAVPSVLQSSVPCGAAEAEKTTTSSSTALPPFQTGIGPTTVVPAAVPSVFQSVVVASLDAEKRNEPPRVPSARRSLEAGPGVRSPSRNVPSGVPSLRQSSLP